MDKNFEILKNIDNEELYSKTFITFENLDAIKNKDFEYFTRFKLIGFIDILSKRLNLDLDAFRVEANEYFDSIEPVVEVEEPKKDPLPFNIEIDKKIVVMASIGVIAVILVIALYSFFTSDTKKDLTDVQVSPPSVVVATPPVATIPVAGESNATFDANKTDENVTTEPAPVAMPNEQIKIIPTKKIWIGVINLDTKEKKGKTTSEPLEIDTSKNQIIVINGAYLSLMVGDKETKYNYEGRVRFMCKDGKIEEISYTYFKSLNNGKGWE